MLESVATALPAADAELGAWWQTDARRLQILRAGAVTVAQSNGCSSDGDYLLLRWLDYLLDPQASQRGMFFDTHLDETSERPPLLPKAPAWLKLNRLSIPEREVALILFSWTSDKPKLAAWTRRWPKVLARVRSFLFSRYCIPLINTVDKAQRASWQIDRTCPRIGGLNVLGFLALLDLTPLLGVFFNPSADLRFLTILIALVGFAFFVVLRMDVLTHNRGVLGFQRFWRGRASKRVLPVMWYSAVWSFALGAGLLTMLCFSGWPEMDWLADSLGHPAVTAIDWRLTITNVLGFVAWCASASLIGALIEWVWQDSSMIDPF